MNFNNDEPLSATTVVVDVDTMAEELKRLRNKLRGEGRDEERGTRDEETPPESPPTSQGGKIKEILEPGLASNPGHPT